MSTIVGFALTLLGPLWVWVRPWLPAASAIRSAGVGLAVAAALAAGVWAVWQLRHLSEKHRIAEAAQAIVDRANLKAENEALRAATDRQAETLRRRGAALEAAEAALKDIETKMKELRDASPHPDTVVVPPGDPWLGGVPKRP